MLLFSFPLSFIALVGSNSQPPPPALCCIFLSCCQTNKKTKQQNKQASKDVFCSFLLCSQLVDSGWAFVFRHFVTVLDQAPSSSCCKEPSSLNPRHSDPLQTPTNQPTQQPNNPTTFDFDQPHPPPSLLSLLFLSPLPSTPFSSSSSSSSP